MWEGGQRRPEVKRDFEKVRKRQRWGTHVERNDDSGGRAVHIQREQHMAGKAWD